MTTARRPDTSDKLEAADSFLNNVVLHAHLTSILLDQWQAFRMTNSKLSPVSDKESVTFLCNIGLHLGAADGFTLFFMSSGLVMAKKEDPTYLFCS